LSVGWFWAAVLLVLPGCNAVFGLDETQQAPNLDRGGIPRNFAVFCDIESRSSPRRCATDTEVANVNPLNGSSQDDQGNLILPQSRAAVALNVRASANLAFDYSQIDTPGYACGGYPQVVTYESPFPEGSAVCVKPIDVFGQGLAHPTADDICIAWCRDRIGSTSAEAASFCNARARASTNYPLTEAEPDFFTFGGSCSPEGALRDDFDNPMHPIFIDPRRNSEPVDWDPASLMFVSTGPLSNSLTRVKPTNGISDAGAASLQTIRSGDAYVQFTANERDTRRMIGLSFGSATDTDPTFNNVGYAIDLGNDGIVRVVENGVSKGAFGAYSVTGPETFRVTVKDMNDPDRTATITYARTSASCEPGVSCPETVFYTHTGAPAVYPFHVDTSFTHDGGTVTNVRIVHKKR
jgi:hypothetical protein